MRKKKLYAQIVYEEHCDYFNGKEGYVINIKSDSGNWGMCTAYPIVDDRVNCTMINKIKELMLLGYEITWK